MSWLPEGAEWWIKALAKGFIWAEVGEIGSCQEVVFDDGMKMLVPPYIKKDTLKEDIKSALDIEEKDIECARYRHRYELLSRDGLFRDPDLSCRKISRKFLDIVDLTDMKNIFWYFPEDLCKAEKEYWGVAILGLFIDSEKT